MSQFLKKVVFDCSTCPEAVCVISYNDKRYECKTIRSLGIDAHPGCLPAHYIMVYDDAVFIPDICPVPTTKKIGVVYSEDKEEKGWKTVRAAD